MRLLCRLLHDLAPAVEPLLFFFGIILNHGPLGQKRDEPRCPELRAFLHDGLQLVSLRKTLGNPNVHRRLAGLRQLLGGDSGDLGLADLRQSSENRSA
ncbi:hypothetical protein D3C73_1272220 [compost metagenome]